MRVSSRRALVWVLILGLAALGACASTRDEEMRRLQARSTYEQALRNLADKRLSLGLASLREAVLLDPENPLFRNTLGVVYLDMRRPADAQAEFQLAVERDPDYAEAYHNLGLAHAEQGRFAEAVGAYRKALSFPTYATPEVAYHNLGNAHFRQDQLREAEEAFRAALQLEPRLIGAHYGLGLALMRVGRRDEAKVSFKTARDLDPTSAFGQAAAEALKALGDGG